MGRRIQVFGLCSFALVVIVVLYGVFARPKDTKTTDNTVFFLTSDIGMMMFVGFGALYTFLKYHGLSGVGYTLLMTGLSMLFYLLYNDFWIKVLDNSFSQ